MDSQGRSRLIIGALSLAAVVLVIILLLTQQGSRLPAQVESPLPNDAATAQTHTPSAPKVEDQVVKSQEVAANALTPTSQVASPLAAPLSESPLVAPAAAASASITSTTSITESTIASEPITSSVSIAAMEALTDTVTDTVTDTAPITSPISVTAQSTVTVTLVAPQAKRYTVKVLATYPHDPNAYTEGLQYVDGELFESTGLYGRSSLRRVELESGKIEQQVPLDQQYFGEGIYVLGYKIYQLTWQSYIGFLYDRATFNVLNTFTYPTEGWALTYDGQDLLMSDGTSTIYRRDPETFDEVGRIEVHDGPQPIKLLNELEYIDGSIWANVWLTNEIVIIDPTIGPTSGEVTGRIDLTGLLPSDQAANAEVLNGIAYDEKDNRIFVTGKLWPSLFQIELVPR